MQLNVPFAVFALPGEEEYHFLCSLPDEAGENELYTDDTSRPFFEISFFCSENPYPFGVKSELTVSELLSRSAVMQPLDAPDIQPVDRSTSRTLYNAQVGLIVSDLKRHRRGKVALSRVIAGTSDRTDIGAIASDYFSMHPGTFRNIYFTQESGLWMGATPEVLQSCCTATGDFNCMSLAGTRRLADGPWDAKNIEEQEYVTNYIMETLRDNPHVSGLRCTDPHPLQFGDIEHLCTMIYGNSSDPLETRDIINPTPAVGGVPLQYALRTIYTTEAHSRNCYAGYLCVNQPRDHISTFVNLRCAFLQLQDGRLKYNIYTGSGLTRHSNADDEWAETTDKAASLLKAITGNQPTPNAEQ